MKQVILDTSFILTCVRQKIDFFEELMEYEIIIPKQVIGELKRLNNSNTQLSLKLLEKNNFKEVDLGKAHVDKLIIRFAKENSKVIVATLDNEIKNKVKNNKLVIRGRKKLEVL